MVLTSKRIERDDVVSLLRATGDALPRRGAEEAVMKEMESVRNAAKRETRELDRSLVPAFDPVRVALLDRFDESMREEKAVGDFEALVIGFDLGTTNLVLTALNERGEPVAAIMEPSESSVRDGVVFDYMALLHGVKKALERLRAVIEDRKSVV